MASSFFSDFAVIHKHFNFLFINFVFFANRNDTILNENDILKINYNCLYFFFNNSMLFENVFVIIVEKDVDFLYHRL